MSGGWGPWVAKLPHAPSPRPAPARAEGGPLCLSQADSLLAAFPGDQQLLPGVYNQALVHLCGPRAARYKSLIPGRYYREVPFQDALPMRRQIRATFEFAIHLFARVREDRLAQVSGSLTFTTLLALVPLLTVTLTVFSAFPVFAGFAGAIRNFILENLIPAASGRVITVYMQQFAENAGKLTTAGLAILGVAAVMMMLTIDRTFNTVWRVPKPRPLVSRLLIYWGALTIGPLLIGASLSLTSWIVDTVAGAHAGHRLGRRGGAQDGAHHAHQRGLRVPVPHGACARRGS